MTGADRRFSTDGLRRPGLVPTRLVHAAARMVPSGPMRTRYRQEFLAELYGLGRWAQVSLALSLLGHSLALRAAIGQTRSATLKEVGAMNTTQTRKPLLCRLGWHHYVVRANPEGQNYRQCSRCGLDHYDDNNMGPTTVASSLAQGGAGPI